MLGSSQSRENKETLEKSSVKLVISDIVVILSSKEKFEHFGDVEEHEDEDDND